MMWTSFLTCILILFADANESLSKEIEPQIQPESLFHAELDAILSTKGFHRTLTYTAIASFDAQYEFDTKSCKLMLRQKIPSGLYIDMDEMQNKELFSGPKIIADQDFDTEKPAFDAEEQTTTIYPSNYEFERNTISFQVTINIHARYQSATANGEPGLVKLESANLYVNCENRSHEREHLMAPCYQMWSKNCQWVAVDHVTKNSEYSVIEVPRGNTNIASFVVATTILTSIISALLIISRTLKDNRK